MNNPITAPSSFLLHYFHTYHAFFPTLLRSDTYIKFIYLYILHIVLFLEFCGVIGLLYSTNMLFTGLF